MVSTNKEELMLYFKQMYTMRRMEITNDTEYKVNYLTSKNVFIVIVIYFIDLKFRLVTFVGFAIFTMDKRRLLLACTPP